MSDDAAGAVLRAGDKELALPLIAATEGNNGYDDLEADEGDRQRHPRPRLRQHRLVHVARSPTSTATPGILRYRGYPIEQLAEKSTLPRESLPAHLRRAADARRSWPTSTSSIRRHTLLHEDLKRFFDGFPRDAHPMPVLSSAVSALSTFYQDCLDPFDEEQVEISTVRLLAKLPTIAAYAYKKSRRPAVPLPRQLARAASRTSCG